MAPVLEVDIDALNADGGRLESLGHPFTPSNCAPPGADSVSLGAARALNAHEMALNDVLEYATRVRETGGAVVRSAAVAFELAHESVELSHGSGIATLGLFAGALVFFARDWISLPEIGSSVTWAGKIENLSVPHMVASSAYRSPWDSCSTASRSPSSSESACWAGTR